MSIGEIKSTYCLHEKYKRINRNPSADGIKESIFIDIVCEKCNINIITMEESIDGSSTYVYDEEWGKKNGYKDQYY